jgi:hypothetical protein
MLAARAVERLAGWKCQPRCDLAPPSLACLGYEPRADALLFPANTNVPVEAINSVLGQACCNGLVVVSGDEAGSPVRAHVVLGAKSTLAWHGPCRLWFSPTGEFWLAGAMDLGSSEIAVPLQTTCLEVATRQWASDAEAQSGLDLASALLAHVMEALR